MKDMQIRTIYGKGIDKPKIQEIKIELNGKGGATAVKCVKKLTALIDTFKTAETTQDLEDRFTTVCGYCLCCKDAGFIDTAGADEVMHLASMLAGIEREMIEKQGKQ
jgi:hypothetical protein